MLQYVRLIVMLPEWMRRSRGYCGEKNANPKNIDEHIIISFVYTIFNLIRIVDREVRSQLHF
jgi:hypothetical protein